MSPLLLLSPPSILVTPPLLPRPSLSSSCLLYSLLLLLSTGVSLLILSYLIYCCCLLYGVVCCLTYCFGKRTLTLVITKTPTRPISHEFPTNFPRSRGKFWTYGPTDGHTDGCTTNKKKNSCSCSSMAGGGVSFVLRGRGTLFFVFFFPFHLRLIGDR